MSEVIYAGNPAVNRPLQNALNRWLMFLGAKPLLYPDGIFGDQTWLRLRQVVSSMLVGSELWGLLFGPDSSSFTSPESFSSREDLVEAAANILNSQADAMGLAPAPFLAWPLPSLPPGAPKATPAQLDEAKAKMAALGVPTDLGGANMMLWVLAGLLAAGAGLVAWKVWEKGKSRRGRGRGRERRIAVAR
jgi:hypothetical protein